MAQEGKEAINTAYSCPICNIQLMFSPEKRSSLKEIKFWCEKCKREWSFCILCDSPDFCIKKGNCIRGFKENMEHRHQTSDNSFISDIETNTHQILSCINCNNPNKDAEYCAECQQDDGIKRFWTDKGESDARRPILKELNGSSLRSPAPNAPSQERLPGGIASINEASCNGATVFNPATGIAGNPKLTEPIKYGNVNLDLEKCNIILKILELEGSASEKLLEEKLRLPKGKIRSYMIALRELGLIISYPKNPNRRISGKGKNPLIYSLKK